MIKIVEIATKTIQDKTTTTKNIQAILWDSTREKHPNVVRRRHITSIVFLRVISKIAIVTDFSKSTLIYCGAAFSTERERKRATH